MIKTVWESALETEKPVLLYGTGNGADKIIDELLLLGRKPDGVFASDGFVRKRSFRDFPVMSYNEAKKIFGEFVVLVAFGSSRKNVINTVCEIAKEQELYAVDVPVYGNNIFNRDFAVSHSDEINLVYSSLADEKSKKNYSDIINFKLSGDIAYLFNCETSVEEAYKNIIKPKNGDIFLDCGAFNGDTIKEFISFCNKYKKIYAVEPDKKNFAKLCENTSIYENIEYFKICLDDKPGKTLFSKHGGRNASSDINGEEIICDTVDNILCSEKADYIKFDVEGLEKNAIFGAVNTIKKSKPKMSVSCYHRSEDIFEIPLQIMNIRNDYKIHIRHFPYIPAWDTQFYFI